MRGSESFVAVACVQFEPQVGHKDRNVDRSVALLHQAADRGAQFCVLPELCNSGYVFNTRAEAYAAAEEVPGGPTVRAWSEVAHARKLFVAAGIAERAGDRLYNTAVLLGPEGYVGKYRKMHLWYEEKLFFEPGDLGFPVYRTSVGTVGMAICYDIWFPETVRLLAVQGADLVCVPTNWVPIPGQVDGERPMAVYLCMTGAHCNGVFIAAADRTGVERGQPFLGHSVLVGPSGWPIAGPASAEREEILVETCNLVEARRMKTWSDLNVILRDRRTDYYSVTLGAAVHPHPF
ncbi:MAG: nitrilase family protein [Armatimonadota bacterium]|nr:nitrilase family protein [Armatimonadota bacterium]MDR7533947.1 nitrilase family protein [Armatimonadota bacterium]MDR7536415.1 nitrilase family protein [Armatimonadota bacterium]